MPMHTRMPSSRRHCPGPGGEGAGGDGGTGDGGVLEGPGDGGGDGTGDGAAEGTGWPGPLAIGATGGVLGTSGGRVRWGRGCLAGWLVAGGLGTGGWLVPGAVGCGRLTGPPACGAVAK